MIRNARTRNKDLQDQIGHLKSMLAQRKDRKRPVKLTDEEQEGLSREEQQRLMEARELQTESDRKREDQALLDARRLIEKVSEFGRNHIQNFHLGMYIWKFSFTCLG